MKQRRQKRRLHPDTIILLKQIFLGVGLILLTALLVTGVWHLTRAEALTIDTVTIAGGETIEHDVLEERVWEELQGTYLKLVPRSFAYMYPRDAILSALAGIPRVKNLTVDRIGQKQIAVTFTEYIADSLWCTEAVDNCVFLDNQSFAFAEAPELFGGTFLRYVYSGRDPQVGQVLLTTQQKEVTDYIVNELDSKAWFVEEILVDGVGDAYISLVDGGEIKIALSQSGEETIANLEAAVSAEEFSGVSPGTFNYIDLRFGNKLFVNRSEEEVATSTDDLLDTQVATSSVPNDTE